MQTHRRRPSKSILLPRTLGSVPHHHSTYARRMTIHLPESVPDNTHLWGYALLGVTFLFFTATMYAMVGSKYAPLTNIEWLDWIKSDDYYCLLVPITAIAWIYFIVWNWMGMKFFRHN
ncbi:phosphatidylinositol N-acetylglucosaminyltransferase subunit Y-domain-containing protein [Chlamydoabsidia padenii]|nr:phosphatidylinositol N-acetylglucosaminyltransferase subunit Y-domain-containing protein [Chlamydoabsidia padenii]